MHFASPGDLHWRRRGLPGPSSLRAGETVCGLREDDQVGQRGDRGGHPGCCREGSPVPSSLPHTLREPSTCCSVHTTPLLPRTCPLPALPLSDQDRSQTHQHLKCQYTNSNTILQRSRAQEPHGLEHKSGMEACSEHRFNRVRSQLL